VKFLLDVTVLINRFCLLGIDDLHVIFTVHYDLISSIIINKCTFCVRCSILQICLNQMNAFVGDNTAN
jgi:hypothetical protein